MSSASLCTRPELRDIISFAPRLESAMVRTAAPSPRVSEVALVKDDHRASLSVPCDFDSCRSPATASDRGRGGCRAQAMQDLALRPRICGQSICQSDAEAAMKVLRTERLVHRLSSDE